MTKPQEKPVHKTRHINVNMFISSRYRARASERRDQRPTYDQEHFYCGSRQDSLPIIGAGRGLQNMVCRTFCEKNPGCGNTRLLASYAQPAIIVIFSCIIHQVRIIRSQGLNSVIAVRSPFLL